MKSLIEPTIFLYLYDLKQALGDDSLQREKNFNHFLEKLPDELKNTLTIQGTQNEEFNTFFDIKEYQELYSERFFSTAQPDDSKDYIGEGYYYPISIFDTYALLLALSINYSKQDAPFQLLKNEVEQRLNHQWGSLGQTWKLSGILPQSEEKTIIQTEQYAQEHYKTFLPKENWESVQNGEFLGSPIFELNSIEKYHTLIVFFLEKEAYEIDNNKYYDDWIRLLSFRHKIVWLYQTIEEVCNQTQTFYGKLENTRASLRQNLSNQEDLKSLRKTLIGVQDLLAKYRRNLYYIQSLRKAIEINLDNYQERLQLMEAKARQEVINGYQRKTNLSFLNQFTERVEKKFLQQTDKNYEFLTLGLNFLEGQISDIRDRLAVERAERDRNFQDIVVIAGAGWAVGSLVQSLELGKLEEEEDSGYRPILPQSLPNPTAQFIYAMAGAFFAAAIVWLFIYLWRNQSHKT